MALDIGGLFTQSDVRETTSQSTLLASKTSYWSVSGSAFVPVDASSATYTVTTTNAIYSSLALTCPVLLPHGAIITSVEVGDDNSAAWALKREEFINATGSDQTLITGTGTGGAETSIGYAEIDNKNHVYFITTTASVNDYWYGAVIHYTTNYN